MEQRRSKVSVKQGVVLRGVADRLKQQSAQSRIEKRRETTKRFRGSNDVALKITFTHFALQNTVCAIKSTDNLTTSTGIATLRNFLSGEDPPIQAVVDSGVISDLIRILAIDDDAPIPDIIWCLTNIATGNHTQTGAIIPAVPALLNILNKIYTELSAHNVQSALNPALSEEVCWAIGNIAGDSDDYRIFLLESGTLAPMVNFMLDSLSRLQHTSIESTQNEIVGVRSVDMTSLPSSSSSTVINLYQCRVQTAIWAITNMARGFSSGKIFLDSGIVAPLLGLLTLQHNSIYPSLELQTEVCWLFVFLTAKEDSTLSALITHQISQIFVGLASKSNPMAMTTVPCVRVLVNISSGPVEWQQSLLTQSLFLPALVPLSDISAAQRGVVKETILLLSNLLEGSYRQQVLQSSSAQCLLQSIVKAVLSDIFDLQRVALFALLLACLDGNQHILAFFTTKDLLKQIIDLLRAPDIDVNHCCLQALRILASDPRSGALSVYNDIGLYDILDEIQYGQGDSELRQVARQLAEDLFENEEEVEVEEAAVTNSSGSGFGQISDSSGFGLHGRVSLGSANDDSQPNSNSHTTCERSGVGRGGHLARPAWMTPN